MSENFDVLLIVIFDAFLTQFLFSLLFLQGFKARSKPNARRRKVKFSTKVEKVCVSKEDP